jgi:hypothetical protein
MNKFRFTIKLMVIAIFTLAFASLAQGQASRTWVSGVGDDANPCSRTAPCKTFAGAISKTAANGKINCLDPGGFGAVTITKSLEIDCLQFPGGILNAGVNGVNVSVNAGSKVILRGIEIHGGGTGLNGVNIVVPSTVMLDKCFITAQTGNGVIVNVSTGLAQVYITDTIITQTNRGVFLATTATGAVSGSIVNAGIFTTGLSGVETSGNGIFASVDRSTIANLTTGSGVHTSSGNGQVNVSNSVIFGNSFGIRTVGAGSIIRISNNSLAANNNSISIGAGTTVATGGNNKVDPVGTTPNGTWTNQ